MNYAKECFELLGGYRNRYIFLKVLGIGFESMILLEVYLFSSIMNSIIQKQWNLIEKKFIMAFLFAMGTLFVNFVMDIKASEWTVLINNDIKRKIYRSCYSFYKYDSEYNSSKLNNIYLNDYSSPLNYVDFIFEYVTSAVTLVYLFIISIRQNLFFLYTVLLIIPVIGINMYYSKQIREYNQINFTYGDKILGIVKNVTSSIYDIVSNKKIKERIDKKFYLELNEKIANVHLLNRVKINLQYIVELILKINMFVFYVLSALLVYRGKMDASIFIFLSMYVQKILIIMIGLTKIVPLSQRYYLSLDRLFEIFDKNSYFVKNEEKKRELECIEELDLDSVFLKIGDKSILNGLSLNIKRGDRVLIEGENGVGKSSLVKILTLQYPFQKGTYSINGNSVDEYTNESIIENFMVSTQKMAVYPLNMESNIFCSEIEISRREDILKDFEMHSYISELEFGLETAIDENFELSGGQKRKINLIRTMCADCSIYILDEPLAHLDSNMKIKFEILLEKYLKNKTVIMIEHNYGGSTFFNRFMSLKDGRLEEHI